VPHETTNEPGRRHDAVTSGTAVRPARPLRRPVVVDLPIEADQLMNEPAWASSDRNARTVATTDRMRIVLIALRAGATLGSELLDDTLSVQLLEGRLDVRIDGADVELSRGQLATVETPRAWEAVAASDSLVLLTSALNEDSHGEEPENRESQ
jgi:quercetin dioxygenase-like cupin family protein